MEQLTFFPEDTSARVKVLSVREKGDRTIDGYGLKCSGLQENCDPIGLLERMLLDTSQWGWTQYSPTWKVRTTQTRTFVFLAVSVGAPHQRYRTFVVAHSGCQPESQTHQTFGSFGSRRNSRGDIARGLGPSVSPSYWQIHQSPTVGVDDGFPNRVDRSIALGNAVVPQQIFPIFYGISYISKNREAGELREKSKME